MCELFPPTSVYSAFLLLRPDYKTGPAQLFLPGLAVMISDSLPAFSLLVSRGFGKAWVCLRSSTAQGSGTGSPSWTASCLCDLGQVTLSLCFAASSAKGDRGGGDCQHLEGLPCSFTEELSPGSQSYRPAPCFPGVGHADLGVSTLPTPWKVLSHQLKMDPC